MHWLSLVKRDPVPWMLDPVNPSVRVLVLEHLFGRSPQELEAERQAILKWEPVTTLIRQWNSTNYWGRSGDPYYGGPLGTLGTLSLLQQIDAPIFPEAQQACENLLSQGRQMDGRFAPEGSRSDSWLCYTGIALQALEHFGYGDDLRTQSARTLLLDALCGDRQELLICPYNLRYCTWGFSKILGALLKRPAAVRSEREQTAITTLATLLVNHTFDFARDDAGWLTPNFPRYYESDLIELTRLLAQTPLRNHARVREFIQRITGMQSETGQWRKPRPSPALQIERPGHPSRWLTFEAVHGFILVLGGNTYAT